MPLFTTKKGDIASKSRARPMRKSGRVAVCAALAAVAAAGIFIFFFAVRSEMINERTVQYAYSVNASSKYAVELKDNTLYPEGWMDQGLLYSRNLFNRIHISFEAGFAGNGPAEISGEYDVSIVVRGVQGSGDNRTVVYERVFTLLETSPVVSAGQSAGVSETVAFSLDEYRSFADNADIILGARPTREMLVVFDGIFYAETEFGNIEEPFSAQLSIPISSSSTDLFTITQTDPLRKSGTIAQTVEVEAQKDLNKIVLGLTLVAISALCILLVVTKTRLPDVGESYRIEFAGIQRKYGSRMVKLREHPHVAGREAIKVLDIESLVKVADEAQRPICYVPSGDGLPLDDMLMVLLDRACYTLTFDRDIPL